jgi:toxin ParE1/3/4
LKRQYVLTPAADRDADEHFIYIAGRSRPAAERFFESLDATLVRLASMPELGQRQNFRRPELAGLRGWQVQGFEKYVIFYRPIERGIEVVRVLHAAEDIAGVFKND